VLRLLLLLGVGVLAVVAGGCQAISSDGFAGRSGCERVESTMCARLIAEVAADRSRAISAIAVRCATGSCDQSDGEVTISVSFADGTTALRNIGWDATALAIAFPTVPTCEGIKVDPCNRQAASGFRFDQAGAIVSIHVRCEEGLCGPDEGTGSTRMTFRDGTVREESWAYASAPLPAPIQP
jgi:hypothetical protein